MTIMKTITLTIDGMSCKHCQKTVNDAITSVSGVSAVKVKLAKKTAIVKFDESITNTSTISDKVTEVGYDVVSVSE
jgi:copper ion binding protein